MDVGGAEPELARPRLQHHVRAVGLDQLLRYLLRAVGRSIVDDYEFPVDVAREKRRAQKSRLWVSIIILPSSLYTRDLR